MHIYSRPTGEKRLNSRGRTFGRVFPGRNCFGRPSLGVFTPQQEKKKKKKKKKKTKKKNPKKKKKKTKKKKKRPKKEKKKKNPHKVMV